MPWLRPCPRPWKTTLLKLGVFLLLGAIGQIAFASTYFMVFSRDVCVLAITSLVSYDLGTRYSHSGARQQYRAPPNGWSRPLTQFITMRATDSSRLEYVFGWPVPALSFEEIPTGSGKRLQVITSDFELQHCIWPGFAINTIFYAAMLWLLWIAPGKVRRFIRIRGHRCPACGYQIDSAPGIGPVCSECGATLPFPLRGRAREGVKRTTETPAPNDAARSTHPRAPFLKGGGDAS